MKKILLILLIIALAGCSSAPPTVFPAPIVVLPMEAPVVEVAEEAVAIAEEAPPAPPQAPKVEEEATPETITILISCATIPDGGIILSNTTLEYKDNQTVFDALKTVAEANGIALKYKSFPSIYIESIDGIGEFDYGPLSGWEYKVNGEIPSVGMGAYKLKIGDRAEILYTCDLGRDI